MNAWNGRALCCDYKNVGWRMRYNADITIECRR